MGASLAWAAPSGSSDLPRSEEELRVAVRAAIEAGDFPAFERLVLWTDVSPYKRRVISAQIRHSLGRPIQKIEVEEADVETRRSLQNLRNLRLNLPVLDLLRVTYGDGVDEPVTPAAVFLVGKLDGAYRIALLVRKADGKDND
jgi:hypothetical protein